MIKGRIALRVDDLDEAGAGVGSIVDAGGGAPVRLHVAGALPGEAVEAEVEHVSPHAPEAWARLSRVVAPSLSRVAPACRAFGRCGGCVLQHLDYGEQLRRKRAVLAAALARAGVEAEVSLCVASSRPLGYRDKSKLVCARDDGRVVLGAYAPRSHEVVDLAGCAIAEPPLDDVAVAVADLATSLGVPVYDEPSGQGALRHVVLRVNFRGDVLAVFVVARRDEPAILALALALRARCPEVIGVVENLQPGRGNVLYGELEPDRILDGAQAMEEDVGTMRLRLSARAFFQLNRGMAARLYADVAVAAAMTGTERVVDVYSGVGGIAITLAPRAWSVLGIEEHAAAVADAAAGADLNRVGNARFLAGDAATLLGDLARAGEAADVVVLNPPRKGCAPEVLDAAARLAPRTILYVSCNPDTLGRDLRALAGLGYAGRRAVTPYDMLPHTPHVEALAVIDRR